MSWEVFTITVCFTLAGAFMLAAFFHDVSGKGRNGKLTFLELTAAGIFGGIAMGLLYG